MTRWISVAVVSLVLVAGAGLALVSPLLAWLDRSGGSPPTASLVGVSDPQAELPDDKTMERLAREDPIAFLENCERKYDQTIRTGYTKTMQKQERIDGTLYPREVVEVFFREKPYAALLRWKEGGRLAAAALYVEGENENQIRVQPVLRLLPPQSRDPNGADARKSGRYPLNRFGFKYGIQRTRATWVAARAENDLKVDYLGKQKLKQADDRLCYVLRRPNYKTPEPDGVSDLTVWIDVETWLQVGVLSKGRQGEVIAEYYFRDVRLNPEFSPDQFTDKALRP